MMKKFLMLLSGLFLMFMVTGSANAFTYYEAYNGSQIVSQDTEDFYFAFDIDLANNGDTNSSLDFTDDATGFESYNNEQLGSVQLSMTFLSLDFRPEAFDLSVNIYWSDADFTENVTFNAHIGNGGVYNYTYDFTQEQIDGWEEGGWGEVLIDAYDIRGRDFFNYNNFTLTEVAMTASNPVPEPTTLVLLGLGLLGITGVSRRKIKK
ncbi:MAG: PEP-CTERM sorting domain-containing protein [archaeon]|nr:PEP-CTERM sorting domain-containing protein [archaeon]